MKGFVLSELGHLVQALAPVSASGGATGQAFSMKNHEHASILVLLGAQDRALTKILVNQCTDASGSNPVAIPYNIYKQETAGASHDVLGARTAVPASGYAPSANAAIFYVIELDASELADGSPYVQVAITNGTGVNYAAILAVLSGSRYAGDPNSSGETDTA